MYTLKNRPLSPHLTTYKIQNTSLVSILQRISGVILFFVLFLLYLGYLFLISHFFTTYNIIYIPLTYYNHYFFFTVSTIFAVITTCTYHTIKGIYSLNLDTKKC
uniref:succinate:cytochrome c oxidoreductase subunit 3 n=1 Tax=Sahlingia subintegra TaxID=468936 RepID=UPI001FCCEA8D|nr:succinate:cytochrome c oxidoreductase subunit 3 [Sahlingia subintegra]UNJ19061.1 succinate:cytochrome c oxidoreductase subunit 3 [Sahlingia subintegra]